MTTKPGSLRPLARATLVEAGMPMPVTSAAATAAAGACQLEATAGASRRQRATVATEAQVPGPGLRRPVPKKVAASHAQRGAGVAGATAAADSGALSIFLFGGTVGLGRSRWRDGVVGVAVL